MNSFSAKIRPAVYCRVSSKEQCKDNLTVKSSLQEQETLARQYANQNGFILSDEHVFVEPGFSGEKFESRQALQALLEAVKTASLNLLIVYATDRLARDQAIYFRIVKSLQEHGVQILSLSNQLPIADPDKFNATRNPQLIVQHGMDAMFGALDNATRTERLRKGRQAQVKNGRFIYAKLPFGYRIEKEIVGNRIERIPVPDERTYWVLEKLPQWILEEQMSLREIIAKLSDMQVPPTGGKFWYTATLSHIVRNPFYGGKFISGRWQVVSANEKRTLKANRDPDSMVVADHNYQHPYDWSTYLKIMAALSERASKNPQYGKIAPRSFNSINPLSGLLSCGFCGNAMYFHKGHVRKKGPGAGGRTPDYYGCWVHHQNKTICVSNRTPALTLVKQLWQVVSELATKETENPESFYSDYKLAASQVGASDQQTMQSTHQLADAEKQLASLPEQKRKADRMYFADSPLITQAKYLELVADFQRREEELKARVLLLQKELTQMENRLAVKEKIRSYLQAVDALSQRVNADLPIRDWDAEFSKQIRSIFRGLYKQIKVKSAHNKLSQKWNIEIDITPANY